MDPPIVLRFRKKKSGGYLEFPQPPHHLPATHAPPNPPDPNLMPNNASKFPPACISEITIKVTYALPTLQKKIHTIAIHGAYLAILRLFFCAHVVLEKDRTLGKDKPRDTYANLKWGDLSGEEGAYAYGSRSGSRRVSPSAFPRELDLKHCVDLVWSPPPQGGNYPEIATAQIYKGALGNSQGRGFHRESDWVHRTVTHLACDWETSIVLAYIDAVKLKVQKKRSPATNTFTEKKKSTFLRASPVE